MTSIQENTCKWDDLEILSDKPHFNEGKEFSIFRKVNLNSKFNLENFWVTFFYFFIFVIDLSWKNNVKNNINTIKLL